MEDDAADFRCAENRFANCNSASFYAADVATIERTLIECEVDL